MSAFDHDESLNAPDLNAPDQNAAGQTPVRGNPVPGATSPEAVISAGASPTGAGGNELHWLAFCYVAGELPAEEVDRFEERLAFDQSAREAVALAVQQAESIAHVLGASSSPPERLPAVKLPLAASPVLLERTVGGPVRRRRLAVWLGAAIAACIAVLALSIEPVREAGELASRPAGPAGEQNVDVTESELSLASIWARADLPLPSSDDRLFDDQAKEERAGDERAGRSANGSTASTSASPNDDPAGNPVVEIADITVPEWLLAAVNAEPASDGIESEDALQKN